MRAPDSAANGPDPQSRTLERIRRVSAGLAVAAALGGLAELAMLRHWGGIRITPWVVFALVTVVGVLIAGGGPARVAGGLARVTGGLAVVAAAVGVWQHVVSNHRLGAALIEDWETLSGLQQWWHAFSGSLGAAPALAPGLLALAGALLVLAVIDR